MLGDRECTNQSFFNHGFPLMLILVRDYFAGLLVDDSGRPDVLSNIPVNRAVVG
jgi:hypothetical protein